MDGIMEGDAQFIMFRIAYKITKRGESRRENKKKEVFSQRKREEEDQLSSQTEADGEAQLR